MKIGQQSGTDSRTIVKILIVVSLVVAYCAFSSDDHYNDSMALTAADCAQIGAGCYSKKVGE